MQTRRVTFPFKPVESIAKAVVICHRNADADSYLSAVAVSTLISSVAPNCVVDLALPEGMTVLTSKLAAKFPHTLAGGPATEYDLYVAVDVGDSELLKEWKGALLASKGMKVLVDHHPLRDMGLYDHVVVEESATSAAEVVCGMYREAGVRIDKKTAQALLVALMFDSSHLSIAGEKALRTVVSLIDSGADILEARRDLRSEPDYGEVLAKLKGAQRLEINRIGTWVVASSSIGSFQAHVARALLSLGADVSVVGGETDMETRVSLRSTQRFADKTGIQLGTQVADVVAKGLGGHGGGHSTAASLSTNATEAETVESVIKTLAGLLGTEVKPVGK